MYSRDQYSDDEIITLSFDDGFEVETGILGVFDVDGVSYIALDNYEAMEVYFYRYIESEDGYELEDIPEEKFERVSQEFDRLMDDDF